MLISQRTSEPTGGQGRPAANLAELRSRLKDPSTLTEGHRQRLLSLTQRLARVRALGDERLRVELSEYARDALHAQLAGA